MPQSKFYSSLRLVGLAGLVLLLAACQQTFVEKHTHGYVVTQELLDQVPIGASREQVLLALGTPTTTSSAEPATFYYISQETERRAFLKPEIVDQRVLAVYFDEEESVSDIGNYGMKDGKVFDYIRRTTRTGGKDISFLQQILSGVGRSL